MELRIAALASMRDTAKIPAIRVINETILKSFLEFR